MANDYDEFNLIEQSNIQYYLSDDLKQLHLVALIVIFLGKYELHIKVY